MSTMVRPIHVLVALILVAPILVGAAALSWSGVSSSARIDARGLSCAQVHTSLRAMGSAWFRAQDDLPEEKYVAHQGYCAFGEVADVVWIATVDEDSCAVAACRPAGVRGR